MVLADHAYEVAITVASPNDAPPGAANPTVKETSTSGSSAIVWGNPSGNNINGVPVNGIDHGRIEAFMKINSFSPGTQNARGCIGFRFIDKDNCYYVGITRMTTGVFGYNAARRSAAVETSIIAQTNVAGVTLLGDTWFKIRIWWWSAANQIWIRIEIDDLDGVTGYVQQGTDTAHSTDTHKGATNKIAWGETQTSAPGSQVFLSFDDLKPSKGTI